VSATTMDLAVIPFPDIDPVIVQLGPFAVRWYALAYIAGLLFAMWYMKRLVETPRLWGSYPPTATALQIDDMFLWQLGGVVLGGRIGYLLFGYGWSKLAADPLNALRIWDGGMSFHGGFFGVILCSFMYSSLKKLRLDGLLDLGAASTPVGLGLGRLANFINGELFGRPSDVPWAMVFPEGGPEPRHPSQLYEFLLEGVLLFTIVNVAVYRFRALQKPGMAAGIFSLTYGLSRILVETLREPDRQLGYFGGYFTMGMFLSLPMLAIGIWLILRSRREA
jgi:phosphatidylglycerol---prolipoprotein diacylglyceryl transferase